MNICFQEKGISFSLSSTFYCSVLIWPISPHCRLHNVLPARSFCYATLWFSASCLQADNIPEESSECVQTDGKEFKFLSTSDLRLNRLVIIIKMVCLFIFSRATVELFLNYLTILKVWFNAQFLMSLFGLIVLLFRS